MVLLEVAVPRTGYSSIPGLVRGQDYAYQWERVRSAGKSAAGPSSPSTPSKRARVDDDADAAPGPSNSTDIDIFAPMDLEWPPSD